MLFLLLLPALVYASADTYIVGGYEVNIASFPWQGSFRTASGAHNCGCVFLGSNYAMSAAHCGGSTAHTLEFGTSTRGSGFVFSVSSVTYHPNYGQGPGFEPNDLSILTTTQVISGTNVSPARIAPNANNPGGTAWITGWGRLCGGCTLPIQLMGTPMAVISDAECSSVWGSNFQSNNMICVWDGPSGTTGACNGDSGGPMTISDTLYGITSWIAVGCLPYYPSVYVRVGAFTSWICSTTGNVAVGC